MTINSTSTPVDELAGIVSVQRERYLSDATKSLDWRMDQLNSLETLLIENQDRFAGALFEDFKTASFEIGFEIGGSLGIIAEAKASVATWMQPTEVSLPSAFAQTGHTAKVFKDPFGVSLIIAPFNAPLILLLAPLVAALSAGNTVVVKPSEVTSHVADLFGELFAKYFDPADVAVVRGNREVVTSLLQQRFDFIFFTGSVPVGKIVMRAAAENLTPVVLELGGENPSIVDETANLVDAARKLVWGAMAFGGQWCVSPGYVYVHESVAEQFVAAARDAVVEFYGDDAKNNSDLSKIATEHDVERLAALIDPAKVVIGGQSDVQDRYVAPTILFPVSPDDAIMKDEIFGPILPVLTYSDIGEVVSVIKSKPSPLTTYIFSTDEKQVDELIHTLPFGGGAVNQTMLHIMFSNLPFGGVGASGMGQYGGVTGFNSFTHAKSVLFSPADQAITEVLPPYDDTSALRFANLLQS
jgi:aldehyde dehydrogenase (NAD+)